MAEAEVNTYVEPQSPPSSYAIAAALEGEPGAWGRVIGVTLARALFIVPGLYLGGIRGRKILTGSLMAATTITGALFILYGLKRSGMPLPRLESVGRRLQGL